MEQTYWASAEILHRQNKYIYHPRSEASEGYNFTGVCHFNSGGGEVDNTNSQPPPPPGTRSQHLCPPPRCLPFDNSTYPLPPPGTRSQHLPPLLGPGHNTSPPLWTTAPTPPLPLSGQQHLPLPPSGQQHLPPPPWTTAPTPLPPLTVNGRAVRILLECILVGLHFRN